MSRMDAVYRALVPGAGSEVPLCYSRYIILKQRVKMCRRQLCYHSSCAACLLAQGRAEG